MGKASKRRVRRRKLKQHDLGRDRHNPALNWVRKARRLEAEHALGKGMAKRRAKAAEAREVEA